MRIDIKPLSVNDAYRGRRFKTPEYKQYEHDLMLLLPKELEIPEGKLQVHFKFGLSSKLADYDNPVKALQDIISMKYGFNDNRIYKGTTEKVDVKKGNEFIEFVMQEYYEEKLKALT